MTPSEFSSKKTRKICAIRWLKNFDDKFNRFGTTPACPKPTDGQIIRIIADGARLCDG